MPKRRGHGEGTIFQRKDGRWCGEVFLGRDAAGKKQVLRFYARSRREVQEQLTKALHDRQQGLLADPSKQTVGQFLAAWLEDVVRGSVRPATVKNYRYAMKHMDAIAGIPLQKLTPQHLQRLYRQKLDSGLTRMVVVMHAVLHKALGQAVRWGLIPRNPADAVERPRTPKKEFRALSPEEAARLLEAAREDRLHALWVLAVTAGMRLGELLGLRWEDVDLERGTVTVRRQLQWLDGEPTFPEPKSARSRRTIALPGLAVAALREHRKRQLEWRLRLGEVWHDNGLVFTTEIGTPLHPSNVRQRHFHPLLERAGLPRIRFHDLRHTCATLLLAEGVHPKVVQEQLGHSQISVTLDTYSHVLPTMMKEAADRMDSLLKAASQRSSRSQP